MMNHTVSIQDTGFVTHDVLQIKTDRPANFEFTPGQATEVAVLKDGYSNKKRPFTFTSLPSDGFLQFTIKIYPDHNGVTDKIQTLEKGDQLEISDAWGAISYKGPGTFIAGGAGVTPFISIFKDLADRNQLEENKLLFANKRERDIILDSKFNQWLGADFVNILSEEHNPKHAHGRMDKEFLQKNLKDKDKYVYICGPVPMINSVKEDLLEIGVEKDKIITEDL
ncbi:FAD-binding oxidoreductase [Croceivirga radicis]|uniref:FAD-binding oxidoreductase n=1 Tax=Croceivirga radicis TaxID=1929488 RepID=UPI0002E10CD9|nr:FAD-binding oxidoreductase [Croceivirga radicis]